jgi:Cof subfamily protein (haloacid dehalogenase superfamily)
LLWKIPIYIGWTKLIRLVTIDLDGTLLDSGSQVSEENRKAIRYCMGKGVKVCLSTGKSMKYAGKIIKDLGLKDLHIVSGGAMVIDSKLEPVYAKRMPGPAVRETVRLARENDAGFVLDTTDGFLYYDRYYERLEHIFRSGEIKKKVEDILRPHIIDNSLMFTITVEAEHPFNQILADSISGQVKIRRGGPYFLNVLDAGAGKTTGLKKAARIYGIEPGEIMVIGDNNNDKGAMEFAGISAAMGNATSQIKGIADYISSDNDNSGVARAVYRFV